MRRLQLPPFAPAERASLQLACRSAIARQSCRMPGPTSIKAALETTAPISGVQVQGWVRTRRDSKDFSFLELNDGSCLRSLQIIAQSTSPTYAHEEPLQTAASLAAPADLVASQGQGQTW